MLTQRQKSAKNLAVKNTARLKQTHFITLAIHGVFLFFAFTLRRSLKLTPYLGLTAPALALEFFLDRSSRPTYDANGSLQKPGDDLDAKGLTEFFWDIIYWTWINLIAVVVFGNYGWWLYLVVPLYAIYAAVTTASGIKGTLSGLAGAGAEGGDAPGGGQSKRQQKMEKRGGQKTVYR